MHCALYTNLVVYSLFSLGFKFYLICIFFITVSSENLAGFKFVGFCRLSSICKIW